MNQKIIDALQSISHGVYVVAVADGDKRNAFTAAWVMQVSFDPLLLAISINPHHYSYTLLRAGGICSVNVLSKQQYSLAEHFGTPGQKDKMQNCTWQTAKTGAPVLSEALAYFDCQVSHYTSAGDHDIAICQIVDAGQLHTGNALLYGDTGDMDSSNELYGE